MVATPESIWRIVSENEAIHDETSMKVVLENYPSDWTRSCYHPVVFFTKNRMTRHKERMALVYPFNSIGRYGLRGHWFAWRKQGQAISSGMHEPFWRFFLVFFGRALRTPLHVALSPVVIPLQEATSTPHQMLSHHHQPSQIPTKPISMMLLPPSMVLTLTYLVA